MQGIAHGAGGRLPGGQSTLFNAGGQLVPPGLDETRSTLYSAVFEFVSVSVFVFATHVQFVCTALYFLGLLRYAFKLSVCSRL